jgi:hypothetical protein
MAVKVANLGMQIFGGIGCSAETHAALWRDAHATQVGQNKLAPSQCRAVVLSDNIWLVGQCATCHM